MRGARGNVLLVVLAVLAIGTSVFAIKHPAKSAPYDGPRARPFVEQHVVYPQVAFLGDSYTGGSEMGGNGAAGWPSIISTKHGWSPHPFTVGGSGYLVGGSANSTFEQRLPKAVSVKPQLLVIWASRNDIRPDNTSAIGAAAARLFGEVKTHLPESKVVVIGPTWTSGDVPSSFYATRDAEQAAAQQAGFPFVDPLSEGWFSGDKASLIGTDHVHPTDAGHRYLASLIDADLDRVGVAKLAAPSLGSG